LHSRHAPTKAPKARDPTPPPTPPENLLTLTPETLNSYTVSHPPDLAALHVVRSFFNKHPPELLFSAAHFRSLPPSPFPEVAFLGRSNVGKSSLLNALFGRPNSDIARVSKKPGKTRTINGFGVGGEGLVGAQAKRPARDAKGVIKSVKEEKWRRFGKGGLVVVDMPGYGGGSREEWGKEIMKYLENRKQLRRTYVLVDTEHGLKTTDLQLLVHLRRQGITHQVVLSKADKLLHPNSKKPGPLKVHNGLVKLEAVKSRLRAKLNEAAVSEGARDGTALGDIFCCSAEKSIDEGNRGRRIGVDELRWSILTVCGLENQHPSFRNLNSPRDQPLASEMDE
jgi:GTP-binding protein